MTHARLNTRPHEPVLIKTMIEKLPSVSGSWIDCTFGAGGYSQALFQAGAQRIIGIDRDPNLACHGQPLKAKYGSRLELCEAKFSSLRDIAAQFNLKQIAGVVFDIGMSSMQLDDAGRGFSFQKEGPLDMRMSKEGVTAADIVNNATEDELANIIYYYGEDRAARVIARAITLERNRCKIKSTQQLASVINKAVKKSKYGGKRLLNHSTRTFQALRIAVNDELEELNAGLISAEQVLKAGAALAVVTFHSLEDRLVKQFIKSRSMRSTGRSRYLPSPIGRAPTFHQLCNKVLKPSIEEITSNPRSRSAKLRIAIKLPSTNEKTEHPKIEFPRVKFSSGAN